MAIDEIIRLLRLRHPSDRWVFATEVETITGFSSASRHDPLTCKRTIDAFAMALWPSLGYRRVVYEIKITRGDWLAELRNPAKRAAAWFLCDEFWFVLGEGVYKKGDLVPDLVLCGLLELQSNGSLKRRWGARKEWSAWPMPPPFTASLLRRVREQAREQAGDQQIVKFVEPVPLITADAVHRENPETRRIE